MIDVEVLAAAVDLARARRPFVLASVVWRRAPSSGQQGARAIITPDGSVSGWLGGACAEPTVVSEALRALSDGEPRLMFLGQPDELDDRHHDGLTSVAMACESEGALEISLEPHLPQARVVAIGRSPAVDTLAEAALAAGWDAVIVDDGGDPELHRRPELVRTKLDLADLAVDRATAVVVATQGHYDDLALDAALRTDAGYVGLVSSARRAEAVATALSARHPDAEVTRVRTPAGLDLGPVTNAEIGIAVMADLVARRARGELTAVEAAPTRVETTDPVCGMTVVVGEARYHAVRDGQDVWFCSAGCQRAFET